jgi:hypothetical protein
MKLLNEKRKDKEGIQRYTLAYYIVGDYLKSQKIIDWKNILKKKSDEILKIK